MNWWLCAGEEPYEGEVVYSDANKLRHVHPCAPLKPQAEVLQEGWKPQWQGESKRFHTFTRPRVWKEEPKRPTGKDTSSEAALARWKADEFRKSPYQYAADLLVWKDGHERCLNGEERMRMLGFPPGYLDAANLSEDAKCSLAGDSFAVPVLARILSGLPEMKPVWPLGKLSVSSGTLKVEFAEAATKQEEKVGEVRLCPGSRRSVARAAHPLWMHSCPPARRAYAKSSG